MIYIAVITFALGIIFGEYGFSWSTAALLFLVGSAASLVLWKEDAKASKIILLVGICLFLGNLRGMISNAGPDKFFAENLGNQASFLATIDQEPDTRDTSTRYTVEPENSHSKILLVASRYPEFHYQDQIKVTGKIQLPKNFEQDGKEFDYVSYLSKDNIHFLIYQPRIELVEKGSGGFFASLYSIKNIFIDRISRVVPEPDSSLLAGLIFGTKQSLGQDLLDKLKEVGLIHIVVLSGYNITILAYWVARGLSRFNISRNWNLGLSAILILLFCLMVGLTSTVVRAAIMAFVALLAKFLGRPNTALRTLFVAGLLMLLYNPLLLVRDPSFQLSFMAALGLILFSPFVYNHLKFIPEKFGLREMAASTLAVQIFLLPMLIRMSGIFSLISFLVNLLIPPLVPYTMGLGALTGAFGLVSKILSWPFALISYLLSEIIIKVVELSSAIPFAFIKTGTLPLWLAFLWYAAYGFIYWRWQNSLRSQTSSN